MINKVVLVLFVTLLMTITFSVSVAAGDEENPEIKDNPRDTYFRSTDIRAVWFHEDPNEPEYLFISMKLSSLLFKWNIERGIAWECNGTLYYCYHRIFFFESKMHRENWQLYVFPQTSSTPVPGTYDIFSKIITWKIDKTLIGNPEPGETLSDTRSFAALESAKEMGASKILFPDYAPDEGFGKEYTIQF